MYKSIKELMTAAADKFRGYLGTADKIPTQDFPAKIDEVYAAGQAAGGGGGASDPAAEAVMALINRTPITRITPENMRIGVFIRSDDEDDLQAGCIIIPPCVTQIDECSISELHYSVGRLIVLSLPTIPPTAGWFGGWSGSGGGYPPNAIYVPDESVGAYKAAEYWSEFAGYIKPMSDLMLVEFRIENPYTGGWANFKAKQGMTWGEWLESDYCTEKDNFKLALDKVAYIDYPPISSSEDRQNGEFVSLTDLIIDGESYTQP